MFITRGVCPRAVGLGMTGLVGIVQAVQSRPTSSRRAQSKARGSEAKTRGSTAAGRTGQYWPTRSTGVAWFAIVYAGVKTVNGIARSFGGESRGNSCVTIHVFFSLIVYYLLSYG